MRQVFSQVKNLIIAALLILWTASMFTCTYFHNDYKALRASLEDSAKTRTDTAFHKTVSQSSVDSFPNVVVIPAKPSVVYRKGKDGAVIHDTGWLEPCIDTMALVRDYLATRIVTATHPVQYGTLTVTDTVEQNRLTGQGIRLEQNIPTVTVTKEIVLKPAKHAQLYFNITGVGSQIKPLEYAGAGFTLKARSGRSQYTVNALTNLGSLNLHYQATYSRLLKFTDR